MLQHERDCRYPVLCKPGGQAEVPLEQGARFPEQIEEFVSCGHGNSVVYNPVLLNRTAPPVVY